MPETDAAATNQSAPETLAFPEPDLTKQKGDITEQLWKTRCVQRIHIKASVEDVWAEITRTDDVIPCFFNSRMHYETLAPGSKLSMRSKNGKYTAVVGEILEVSPPPAPCRFCHTFRFTNLDDPPSKVTFELNDKDGGTDFQMIIEDLTPGSKSAKQMVSGGRMILSTLKRVMETGKPSAGTRALFVLFKALEPISPKRCKTEHWS